MLRGAFRSIFELWWKAAKQDARRNIEHMKRGQPFPSISIPFHGRSRPAPEAGAKTRRAERALQRIWQDTLTRGGRDGMIGLYPPTITLTPAERNRLAEIAPGIDGGTAESRQKLKRFFGQILEARKVNISKEEEEELREEEAILEEETRKEVREERKAKGEQPKTGKTDPHQNQENVEFHKRMQQRLKELRDRQRTNARKEFLNNRIRDHKNQVNKETHWKKGRN